MYCYTRIVNVKNIQFLLKNSTLTVIQVNLQFVIIYNPLILAHFLCFFVLFIAGNTDSK